MSADDGWVLRFDPNDKKYVLQQYFASDDEFPDVAKGELRFDRMEDAVRSYQKQEDPSYPSEYGLSVQIPSADSPKKTVVPLVLYIEGERKVIGSAEVEDCDGELSITGNIHAEYSWLLQPDLTFVSMPAARRS